MYSSYAHEVGCASKFITLNVFQMKGNTIIKQEVRRQKKQTDKEITSKGSKSQSKSVETKRFQMTDRESSVNRSKIWLKFVEW